MLVQVNTDKNVDGHERLTRHVQATVAAAFDRFADRLTRVEVHLTDENSDKVRGKDKKCVMEARPVAIKPIAVSHLAKTIDQAVNGATAKLERRLDRTFERRYGVGRGAPR